jgi:hypothetical protein
MPPIPCGVLAAPLTWTDDEEEPMGMSVDIYYGDYDEIVDALVKAGCSDRPLVEKILKKFGVAHGNCYMVLNNEHIEASPLYGLGEALEMAFDRKADGRFHDVIIEHTKWGISHADASMVCEELGVEWPDEEED